MKKIISLFLTVTMIASLIVAIPVTNVAAAETITDEALFMTYPTYLSNSEMDEGLTKAEAAYYAVINSYSKSDETVAKAVTMLSEGVDIAFNEALSVLGITHNYYETCAKKAAKKYMQSMLQNENVLKKATKKVQTAYKGIKTVYSTATVVAKEELIIELTKVAAENDIGISTKAMDAYVKSAYESGTLKNDLDAIGAVNDLWKYVIEFSELHAIEMTTIDMLMEELLIAGLGDSDLFIGLGLLKEDIAKDEYYILENYATKTVISLLSKFVDELIGNVTGSVHLSLIKSCIKIFSDYVYVNAKADEITQAIMQTSFVNSIDICLSKYRLNFLQGKGTTADIETYENLYAASISARIAILDACYDVAKITDKFSLGGDCLVWKDLLEYNYTYDNYIKWCKEAVAHDIANAELDKTTGESTITDALNEETIKARLDKIRAISLYKPNAGNTFRDAYQTEGTLGFAALVFNRIFDREMGTRVENRYNHVLTNNKNVRVVGRLEESDVTVSALIELFSEVRIGDILLTSGQYDYLHAMVVISVENDGVIVYDCDSKYTPDASKDMERFEIREYKVSYEKMADAFSESGVYMSVPGISVYRAIKKINTTNSGSNLYYEEYDDSVNYVIENGVLKGYNGSRTTIEIPDGVTSIAANCFKNNTSIKYVYMPDTITEIGNSAFSGCTNLKYVDLSSGITLINNSLFYNCNSLGSLIMPDSVLTIKTKAFYDCKSLSNIVLSSNLETIEENAFTNCISLKSISIPKSLKVSGTGAGGYGIFLGCTSLKSAVLEDGIETIPNNLFSHCVALESISIPDSVVCIGAYAFDNCFNLQSVKLSANLEEIYAMAFAHCYSLRNITLPNGLYAIWSSAFWDSGLNSIHIPNSVEIIEWYAFESCDNLKTITIGEKVRRFYSSALNGCINLETVYWNSAGKDVYYTFGDAFGNAGKANGGFTVVFGNNVTAIPNKALSGAKYLKTAVIPEGVTQIGSEAFKGCINLDNATLPESLERIEEESFVSCNSLQSITIPQNVSYIGTSAFGSCENLETVYWNAVDASVYDCVFSESNTTSKDMKVIFGESVKTIPNEAFCDNNRVTDITIGKNVEEIGASAFSGCSMRELVFPDRVIDIGDAVIQNCNKLESVTLPATYNNSKLPNMFEFVPNLLNISVPDSNKTYKSVDGIVYKKDAYNSLVFVPSGKTTVNIAENCERFYQYGYPFATQSKANKINVNSGNTAFSSIDGNLYSYDKRKLLKYASGKSETSFDIPTKVTEISSFAFDGAENLCKISIPDSVDSIGVGAFRNCTKLQTVDLPDEITAIPDSAFSNSGISDITLPNSVTSIGEYAFQNCKNLKSINIPRNVNKIEVGAFYDCSGLTDVYYGGNELEWTGLIKQTDCDELLNATIHFEEQSNTDVPDTKELEKYDYEIEVGFDYYNNSIAIHDFYAGEKAFIIVPSKNFDEQYALMDVETGGIVLDNMNDNVIEISKHSDLIAYTSGDGCSFIYDLESESVVCELASLGSIGNYDGYSEEGFLAHLASDEKLHFITNDGIIGNAIDLDCDSYINEQNPDILWEHLGEGCYQLGVGTREWYMTEEIGIFTQNGVVMLGASAYGFNDGLGIFQKDDMYGVMDKSGELVITCQYDDIASYFSNSFVCYKNDKYGVLDGAGNIIIPFEYDDIYSDHFSNLHIYMCAKNGKYGVLDANGNIVVPFEYDYIYWPDSDNIYECVKDDKCGIVDTDGNVIIPFEYDNISYSYASNLYKCLKDDIYYGIDKEGNVQFTFVPDNDMYDNVSEFFGNGLALVSKEVKENGYYISRSGVINIQNDVIIPIEYRNLDVSNISVDNLRCIYLSKESSWDYVCGYIDEDGNEVIPFEYEYVNDFSEGLAVVCKNDKYGFIDKEGKVVIPFEYEYAESFSEGLAVVRKDGKYGFINKERDTVIPFIYTDATSFVDGVAEVWFNYNIPSIKINKNNEILSSNVSMPKYSLTRGYNLDNFTYTGVIRNNETGEEVDISHLNLLPYVLGKNGQFVIGFTRDFTKAYRIMIDDMFANEQKTEIRTIEVTVDDIQAEVKVQVENAPADAVVYVASYDTLGKLLELQNLTLNNGVAGAIFSTSSVYKYKAFIWKNDTIKPLSAPKEYIFQ